MALTRAPSTRVHPRPGQRRRLGRPALSALLFLKGRAGAVRVRVEVPVSFPSPSLFLSTCSGVMLRAGDQACAT